MPSLENLSSLCVKYYTYTYTHTHRLIYKLSGLFYWSICLLQCQFPTSYIISLHAVLNWYYFGFTVLLCTYSHMAFFFPLKSYYNWKDTSFLVCPCFLGPTDFHLFFVLLDCIPLKFGSGEFMGNKISNPLQM